MRSNCVRADLWCSKLKSVGFSKYDAQTRYKQNVPYKNPVCDTFMKFSNLSTSMVEEMTEEEELSSMRSYEMQVRKVGVAPCNPGLSTTADSMLVEMTKEEDMNYSHSYETQVRKVGVALCNPDLSTTATERKLSGGDKRGWAMAKNKLAEDRKEMNSTNKIETNGDGSQVSNKLTSVKRIQGFSMEGVSNIVRQNHGEHVQSSVKYSVLDNSKTFTDSETVFHQFNEPALEISQEKIPRVNVDDDLEETQKDSTDAIFAKKERCADQLKLHDRLCRIYEDVLVVDNIPLAEEVVKMLTVKYRHLIYACDTEV